VKGECGADPDPVSCIFIMLLSFGSAVIFFQYRRLPCSFVCSEHISRPFLPLSRPSLWLFFVLATSHFYVELLCISPAILLSSIFLRFPSSHTISLASSLPPIIVLRIFFLPLLTAKPILTPLSSIFVGSSSLLRTTITSLQDFRLTQS
jgi:hypothetical protein